MDIIIATNNHNKVKEIKRIYEMLCAENNIKSTNIHFFSLKDKNLILDVEENGATFAENSLLKAKAVAKLTNISVIADDSGICVDALNGAPGIYSNRFACENNDAANRRKLLLTLQEKGAIDKEERKAHFECAMTFISNTEVIASTGKSNGYILNDESGEHGFGYDCIFYSSELNKSWGLASDDEKNTVSHRARALKNLLQAANLLNNFI